MNTNTKHSLLFLFVYWSPKLNCNKNSTMIHKFSDLGIQNVKLLNDINICVFHIPIHIFPYMLSRNGPMVHSGTARES